MGRRETMFNNSRKSSASTISDVDRRKSSSASLSRQTSSTSQSDVYSRQSSSASYSDVFRRQSSSATASDEDGRKSSTATINEIPRLEEDLTLPENQRIELREAFSMFEKTGKGRMNVRDLGALLRCLGWNPSEQDMEEAKRELEVNKRGHIPFANIERYVARRGGIYWDNNDEEDILTAFQALDRNGCGKIKVSDFKHFMMTMGEQMSQEEVEEMVECTAKNDHDVIDYKDNESSSTTHS